MHSQKPSIKHTNTHSASVEFSIICPPAKIKCTTKEDLETGLIAFCWRTISCVPPHNSSTGAKCLSCSALLLGKCLTLVYPDGKTEKMFDVLDQHIKVAVRGGYLYCVCTTTHTLTGRTYRWGIHLPDHMALFNHLLSVSGPVASLVLCFSEICLCWIWTGVDCFQGLATVLHFASNTNKGSRPVLFTQLLLYFRLPTIQMEALQPQQCYKLSW